MMKQLDPLARKILSDRHNELIFKAGEKHRIYLVGGYIRDLMRGIHSKDRDFIIGKDIKAFIAKIKKVIPGTSVSFKKGQVTRFVLKNGTCFDFAPLHGTLKNDLAQRDFSINALAWTPNAGILDFYKGINDLRRRTVRTLSVNNLLSDPVRIVRAYRFAAELDGKIEPETRNHIKSIQYRLKESSPERITLELFHLLNLEDSAKYLKKACNDGVLRNILSLTFNRLRNNIQSLSEFEQWIKRENFKKYKVILKNHYSQYLTYKGLLSLECLFAKSSPDTIKKSWLRMSKKIVKRLIGYNKGMEWLEKKGIKDAEKIFTIFFQAKESAYDILLTNNMLALLSDYNRYINLWKGRQISTDLIKNISGIQGGKLLGSIIYTVRMAEFKGEIKTKGDARKFIRDKTQMKQ